VLTGVQVIIGWLILPLTYIINCIATTFHLHGLLFIIGLAELVLVISQDTVF